MDVLLVDDNVLMQQLIARFLGELGYTVGVAGLASEALARARQSPPALLLIDMHLPDCDGPDALAALRRLPGCAGTPAVAISGLAEEDARHLLKGDFSEYLVKPIDLDTLQATVARYLGPALERSVA
ncbi:MAG TPA: response regulator [Kouleothrix sp.]|nr:response regulator [Kouleothrix sp.]HRC74429.1 response regulator [Kouleothrix sp.]